MTKKKKNYDQQEEKPTIEMDLRGSLENTWLEGDITSVKEAFPDMDDDQALFYLEDMPLEEALLVIKEDRKSGEELASKPQREEKVVMEAPKEVIKAESPKFDSDAEYRSLMAEQELLAESLAEKSGGSLTIDDTIERSKRQDDVSKEGRRKGKPFKPGRGVARFMMEKNATYLSQNKTQPYSDDCVRLTIRRENGETGVLS